MQRSSWIAVALAGVLVSVGETRAGSKPASLPNNQQIECPDCQEGSPSKSGLDVDALPRGSDPAPTIDTVSPSLAPLYFQFLFRQLGGVFFPETTVPAQRAVIGQNDKADAQAKRYFEMGEFYRRTGHLGSARFCYQRAHSLQPTTTLGVQAIERLTEIEGRLREAEESGGDDPETLFRQMREQTVPLGLVENRY